jgi:2-oxoglutarate ferredoxin oxidoreductase subunit gamma
VAAGRNATHAQAYGPESRGGASKADVIISDGEIDYPCADDVDVLVALTQKACDEHGPRVVADGCLLVDERVTPPARAGVHRLPLVATAQRALGTPVGANLVALGALAAITGCVPAAALEQAIAARRPGGNATGARAAFRAGLALVPRRSA